MIVDAYVTNGVKMTKKLTIDEFKERFSKRFPNKKFDFSKSKYVDSHTLMTIICGKGHTFEMRPCNLMTGCGCPKCCGTFKLTRQDFIRDATFVHNGYFTYERSDDFTNVSSMVTVTCPMHGDFKVKANNHLNGANCKRCQQEGIKHKITKRKKLNRSTKKLSQDDFLQKLKEKYGDKYIITNNTIYRGYNKKTAILCPIHGEFQITPSHLLNGRGCPYCGGNKEKTRDEVIELIKKAQPYSDFDFSEFDYKGIHTSSIFKCNKCNCYFYNSPSNLIFQYNGCPSCNGSIMEKEIKYMLDCNGINYAFQKTFDWLVDKRHLYLDFYLNDYNVAIECQGKQHFESVNFGNGYSDLNYSKEKDNLKQKLCEEHNIKLFYYANYDYSFPYNVYTDKEELLNNIKLTNES